MGGRSRKTRIIDVSSTHSRASDDRWLAEEHSYLSSVYLSNAGFVMRRKHYYPKAFFSSCFLPHLPPTARNFTYVAGATRGKIGVH